MRNLFGTDGIRGTANQGPLTPSTLVEIAQAAGKCYSKGKHRHTVVIGKDTRLSGYMIEAALAAGFLSVGMDVIYLGPVPTPAVSFLTRSLRADLGVMISASHNPAPDNGIKFFGPDGFKLSDMAEAAMESKMSDLGLGDLVAADHLAKAKRLDDAQGRYIEFVKNTFPRGMRLDGLKIVIDCAHGAAYKIAPPVLWELGADIIPMGVQPNGFNINLECGATHTAAMQAAVLEHGADLGISLDGDADRVILSDEEGHLIDGDALLALIATQLQESGGLKTPQVVGTHMSNLALERFLSSKGIELLRANVGDRYVMDMMRQKNLSLGGEQSGHIILSDFVNSGDGLITALHFLAIMVKTKKSASKLGSPFAPMPQILENVRVSNPDQILARAEVKAMIERKSQEMKGRGRLLIRKSGTEPLIRIMVEGDHVAEVQALARELTEFFLKQSSVP